MLSPGQQKLSERLLVLRHRGHGLLTRVYNIKKAGSDANSKPSFLSDKQLEPLIRAVVRKFPTQPEAKVMQALQPLRHEVVKSLSLYYNTFVDLLDFKDHVAKTLTLADACQQQLDLTLNFDLTSLYLDVACLQIRLILLLCRVEDRKAVLGLYNAAHAMADSGGRGDSHFPRLAQMVADYDDDKAIRKLAEDFAPHSRTLTKALLSLQSVYPRRNLGAEKWRAARLLSLTALPTHLLNPAHTDTVNCEFLSLESMERWLYYLLLVSPTALNGNGGLLELWIMVLESTWVLPLFRDEVIYLHSTAQAFFESIKGNSKRAAEVKELASASNLAKMSFMHRERRGFLRSALRELTLLCTDQPGLLGPKALFVFMALALARDEVLWLVHHHENPPVRHSKSRVAEDLVDRHLPELLFHMEELRALVRKYNQVVQRYFVQYLAGYDAIALKQIMHNQSVTTLCTEDWSVILSSICTSISNLSVDQVEDPDHIFDFRALRLDWMRLQSYMFCSNQDLSSPLKSLSNLLNTVSFHTKLVDSLEDLLTETSDLSLFCFHAALFESHFQMCLEFPAQNRFIIAFPLICAHFSTASNDFCPEERSHLRERSLNVANLFLDEMAKEAKNIITTICDEQSNLSDQLLPKHAAKLISQALNTTKNHHQLIANRPGMESYRKSRELLTTMDKLHMALTELCFAINHTASLSVWEYTFAPREYLAQHLEARFARALNAMLAFSPETASIAKPSELLSSLRAYMQVLQGIENVVHIDITRIFNNVLLQQTQPSDSNGEQTLASAYTSFYADILLRRVSAGNICLARDNLKSFIGLTPDSSIPFSADEFSDPNELRALAELLGPYGFRLLGETLLWHVGSQVQELRKVVSSNRETLVALRTNFDKPEVMRELTKRLVGIDSVLQRMTIIGVILSFRGLLLEALSDQLGDRIPFLYSTLADVHSQLLGDQQQLATEQQLVVSEMALAAGFVSPIDPMLVQTIKALPRTENTEEDEYLISCLLMVCVAVCIPKLAISESSIFRAQLEGHDNNIHCLAEAINQLLGVLFTLGRHDDLEERLKEFLALASSSLLRLAQESEVNRNRESVYILLDLIVQKSPWLSMDLLESCFPYTLLRNSYHIVHKMANLSVKNVANHQHGSMGAN